MRHGRRVRSARARLAVIGALAVGLLSSGLTASPAGAAEKLYEQTVVNFPTGTPIYTGNAACPRVPGITNEGKVWATFYLNSDLSRYVTLRFRLFTNYQKAVATAAEAFKWLFNRAATCQELYRYENYGEIPTLYNLACQNPYVAAGRKPTRWCDLAGLSTKPPSVDLEMEKCREPQLNYGQWNTPGYAGWHDLRDAAGNRVKLDTIDIYQEAGIEWMPGHITAPVYMDDFEMGFGVSDVDPATAGNQYVSYGRVQTPLLAEYGVRVYDDWAWRLGKNPSTNPLDAHRRVQTAINFNQNIPGVGAAGTKWREWKQLFCNNSPWMRDALGDKPVDNNNDGEPDRLVLPQPNGTQCDAGFAQYNPKSAQGVGKMFEAFVAAGNDGRVPAVLRQRSPFIPLIIRESYRNTGSMALRDPMSAYSNPPGPICPTELDLGTGRNTHFVRLVKNLGALLG